LGSCALKERIAKQVQRPRRHVRSALTILIKAKQFASRAMLVGSASRRILTRLNHAEQAIIAKEMVLEMPVLQEPMVLEPGFQPPCNALTVMPDSTVRMQVP
jgi:hypothetical protein